MGIEKLGLRNVGQMVSVDVSFGDLTVLVGKQATGKTVFLEFLKLIADKSHVHSQLAKHGFDWNRKRGLFLDLYLGEGMQSVWTGTSRLIVNGESTPLDLYSRKRSQFPKANVFYIPAQRVLTLANGWPRPFQSYGTQDPYVVRDFSEQFRVMMDKEFSRGGALFPQTSRLKKPYRDLLKKHIFGNFELGIDTHGAQRRLMLSQGNKSASIPYMAWSAGQREFVPLLMGLYWLLPGAKISRRDSLKWVIIEEIETGLHPSAISTLLLIVMELLSRDYKVCLSTHSPHVLDVLWALRFLRTHTSGADKFLEMFQCRKTPQTREMAQAALKKEVCVYYFDDNDGIAKNISELDPGSETSIEAGWGGLTEFSGRVSDIVASVVQDAGTGNGNDGEV